MDKKYLSEEEIRAYIEKLEMYNKNKKLNIDMHNHTTGSDGMDSPLMLLLRAYNLGLDTVSITDHNSVSGYAQLEEQVERIISNMEDISQRNDISQERKKEIINRAKSLLAILEKMNIVTGCEVLTIFKGCPYVEILAYGADIETLNKRLQEIRAGLDAPGEVLYKGLKANIKKHNIKIDEFFMENRNDYKKLFFHELMRHPENDHLYESIEGANEQEKAENFAREYLQNPESDFYVDLDNPRTRKKAMQQMIKAHKDMVFDIEVIKNAGSAAGQFYNELIKYPENKPLIDPRITSLKKFNYLGLYNRTSPFFVDLSTTKPTVPSVVKAIHDAGGKALIAHWGRYILSNEDVFNWQTPQGLNNLEELLDLCDGAECAYPDNSLELQRTIYKMCKDKGKMISIGGDNHGKSGKEGKQYQLGSQTGREVEGLEWVKQSTINGAEFISQMEEKHKFRKRLKEFIIQAKAKEKENSNQQVDKNKQKDEKEYEDYR